MKLNIKRNMAVQVNGKNGVVVFPSINRVKVQYTDGKTEMVSYASIKTKSVQRGG